MAKDEEDDLLPDKDAAKGFYAKYEPKEILGRYVFLFVSNRTPNLYSSSQFYHFSVYITSNTICIVACAIIEHFCLQFVAHKIIYMPCRPIYLLKIFIF